MSRRTADPGAERDRQLEVFKVCRNADYKVGIGLGFAYSKFIRFTDMSMT